MTAQRWLAACAILLVCSPSARAQSEGTFAIGASLTTRAPDETATIAHGSSDLGILWRFGHRTEGWGWNYGFNWFAADLNRSLGGRRVEFGELRVRPLMGGYGYTHLIGRAAITADVLGGYALTSFSLAPSANDVYHERLGARLVRTHVGNTFAMKPEIELWYDVSRKVGLNINAGYVIARPRITVTSTIGNDSGRFRADMFIMKMGIVYSVF